MLCFRSNKRRHCPSSPPTPCPRNAFPAALWKNPISCGNRSIWVYELISPDRSLSARACLSSLPSFLREHAGKSQWSDGGFLHLLKCPRRGHGALLSGWPCPAFAHPARCCVTPSCSLWVPCKQEGVKVCASAASGIHGNGRVLSRWERRKSTPLVFSRDPVMNN